MPLDRSVKMFVASISLLAALSSSACAAKSFHGNTVESLFSDDVTQRLASAACKGDAAEVDRLIAGGARANDVGKFGVTPLIWALTCDGIALPSVLGERVASTGIVRPLRGGDPEFLAGLVTLLKSGGNPNQVVNGNFGPTHPGTTNYVIDGYTPVLIAAEFREVEILTVLLKYGGDPNARDSSRQHTALSRAFDRGFWLDLGPQMAPYDRRQWANFYALLDAKADLDQEIANGSNIVEKAVLSRPDIALDVLRRYRYDGAFDAVADYAIQSIEAGFPDQDRRALLNFLKTEKRFDVDTRWKQYKKYLAEMRANEER